MTHADLIDLGISSLDEFAAKVRRDAMGDAVKIIMSLTEPGERAPAGYFASALERAP